MVIKEVWRVEIDTAAQPEKFMGQVTFPEYLKINDSKTSLTLWEDWGLKYFTGYIDYNNTFSVDSINPDYDVVLDIGTAYHMSEVWINGKEAGYRLWPPFKFDITDLLFSGQNTIKIRVGNLLINNMQYYIDNNKLDANVFYLKNRSENYQSKSGLIGPVTIYSLKTINH